MELMLNKIGLVIPTHLSKKGNQNRSWGPPSTGWIEKTIDSLYKRCPDAKSIPTTIVLNADQVSDYERSLRVLCNQRNYTLRLDSSPGYRGVRLNMCEWFKHDYLFLVEHDWELCVDLDLVSLVQTFEEHDHVNYIRFNKRANVVTPKLTATRRNGGDLYLIQDTKTDVPLLATPQYSNNPHIERMSKYREWCEVVKNNPVFAGMNGGAGGFEHPLQEKSLDDMEAHGISKRNEMWGTYIYGKIGDPQATKHFGI